MSQSQPLIYSRLRSLASAFALLTCGLAQAEWQAYVLPLPANAFGSATAVRNGVVAGTYVLNLDQYPRGACYWPNPGSLVDLQPAGVAGSSITCMTDTAFYGNILSHGAFQAAAFTPTGLSALFEPASSDIHAAVGNLAVGRATVNSHSHATVWNTALNLRLDLHPSEGQNSVADATFDLQVGGRVDGSAALWPSLNSAWINLHPVQFNPSSSRVTGMASGIQTGFFFDQAILTRACIWRGTAASAVDLNPAGAWQSRAYAAWGNVQVGEANFEYTPYASLWRGTPDSYENLHQYLDPIFRDSTAFAVHSNPALGMTWVAGSAFSLLDSKTYPVLWVHHAGPQNLTWSGVLPPLDPNGGSTFKVKSPVQVKFRLTGASAGITDLEARLFVARIQNGVVGNEQSATSHGDANLGNHFRYDSGQYSYQMSTRQLAPGTWRLRIDFGDGVLRAVNITLRP